MSIAKPSRGARFLRPLFLCGGLLFSPVLLSAPLIEEQQSLDFGTLAVTANASVSRFTYPYTDNNLNIEGQLVLVQRGRPGHYSFSGFPANTPLTVSVTSTTLSAGGTGTPELLTIDDFSFAELTTNAQGEAELWLGGRLSTSGNGGDYVDAAYSGSTQLRVDYWQPAVSDYVFNTLIIDIDAAMQSTLSLTEQQPLDFGTLFARTSTTAQATLSLSPSGTYSVSEPDGSRLVSITKPQPAIVLVSGAAPSYNMTITPQAGDVLLQHTVSPGSSPHFILSDLITSPDGIGRTDENGELLINIGGTLKIEQTPSVEVYPAGVYEGTYQLTVSY